MTRLSQMHDRYRARLAALAALSGQRIVVPYRYMEKADYLPAVLWGGDGKAWVNVTPSAGLRFVGKVLPESYGGPRSFEGGEWTGWYTNPDGYVYNDGDGLVWGVVYQLPSRKRTLRCIAGYMLGGFDDGPTLDFKRIFTSKGGDAGEKAKESDAAREAARHADAMAQEIGAEECEYVRSEREKEEAEEKAKEEADE